ncbi:serralysin family metalloprotease [Serratia proteamaculans]|jgi:serralysin|uniref:serralysin family metalloprotease n=1 Tax=Serratia proteamaculans TaxID=28151 RepID=UPI000D9E8E5C|nr:serralysin family metalloprotease [Serratia proteamaculans]SPZ56177.1 Serralysin precursor [Serratia quinivorans]CAI0776445.1 Serralysin precursor [Serratia proteamaculans]CAI0804688.1 Serralysin precursor [Serratia proteamaculans]CAI0806468.1 Serralysin precursor [Serratia proteamaculans]CAI1859465.1 Serralysin precursor [Serratia proteamaculans]
MSNENYIYNQYDKSVLTDSDNPGVYKNIDLFWHYQERGNYTLNGRPSDTAWTAGVNLARNQQSWNGTGDNANGKAATITYAFPTWQEHQKNGLGDGGLTGLDATQKAYAKASLQAWADVANLTFKELPANQSQNAQIKFGNFTLVKDDDSNYAILPHTLDEESGKPIVDSWGHDTSGQVWFLDLPENRDPSSVGGYGAQVFTHEIGHALGLDHPGTYNGDGATYQKDAKYVEDTNQFSIMSYFSELSPASNPAIGDFHGDFASGPLMDDIAGIQYLYGANTHAFSGNTVYGFNSNTQRDYLSTDSNDNKVIFSAWDTGGNDTFDFSGYTAAQRINLNQGSFSDVGGLKGNVSITQGTNIENAIGGSGNDILVGNALNNLLKGGAGNDFIFGGAGADTLWGGAGKDTFAFAAASDSKAKAPDTIKDFTTGVDKIDLSAFAADIQFVGAFSGNSNEATITNSGSNSILKLDLQGHDTGNTAWQPDFLVNIVGHANASTDFIV